MPALTPLKFYRRIDAPGERNHGWTVLKASLHHTQPAYGVSSYVTNCGRFTISKQSDNTWSINGLEMNMMILLSKVRLQDEYFPTRQAALVSLEAVCADAGLLA